MIGIHKQGTVCLIYKSKCYQEIKTVQMVYIAKHKWSLGKFG